MADNDSLLNYVVQRSNHSASRTRLTNALSFILKSALPAPAKSEDVRLKTFWVTSERKDRDAKIVATSLTLGDADAHGAVARSGVSLQTPMASVVAM